MKLVYHSKYSIGDEVENKTNSLHNYLSKYQPRSGKTSKHNIKVDSVSGVSQYSQLNNSNSGFVSPTNVSIETTEKSRQILTSPASSNATREHMDFRDSRMITETVELLRAEVKLLQHKNNLLNTENKSLRIMLKDFEETKTREIQVQEKLEALTNSNKVLKETVVALKKR